MKELKELSRTEYKQLEEMGYLYEFYPAATGYWWEDAGQHQWTEWQHLPLYMQKFVEYWPWKRESDFPMVWYPEYDSKEQYIISWEEYQRGRDLHNVKYKDNPVEWERTSLERQFASTQDQMITELEEVYNSLGEFIRRWK